MKTIRLSPNWVLQGVRTVFIVVIAVTILLMEVKALDYALVIVLTGLLLLTMLNISPLKFLHFYKAGVCFSRGLSRHYINADDIAQINVKRYLLITVVQIKLKNDKQHLFYNWWLSAEQDHEIANLYHSRSLRVQSVANIKSQQHRC